MNEEIPNIPLGLDALKQKDENGNIYWKARELSKALSAYL